MTKLGSSIIPQVYQKVSRCLFIFAYIYTYLPEVGIFLFSLFPLLFCS